MDIKPVPGLHIPTSKLRKRGLIGFIVAVLVVGAGAVAFEWSAGGATEVTLRVVRAAPGIKGGTPVQVSGFRVGEVREVTSLGGGHAGVVLELTDTHGLTDSMGVEFGSGNLFGVAEVVLRQRSGGSALRNGTMLTPLASPVDNTISTILDLVGTINHDAIRPNAGQLLANADRTIGAVQPWLTTLGTLAAAVSDTERVRPGRTLPIWADVLQAANGRLPSLLDALDTVNSFAPGHDKNWAALLDDGVDANAAADGTIGTLRAMITPDAARSLDRAAPLLSALADPITASLGGRGAQIGLDLERLLHAVYGAMPSVNGAPVLGVSVVAPTSGAPALTPAHTPTPAATPTTGGR